MALNLVKKFRDLAAVEANRPVIVRDQGCLPLLLSHISSSDSDIVIVALEGINFLSMCPENRPLMRNERGLLSLVQILKSHSRPEISKLAGSIVLQLDISNQENQTPKSNGTPYNSNASTPSSSGANGKKRARTVTVYAPELSTECQRKLLSEALLNVKGVISFLIDLYAQKVVIRTMTTPGFLVKTLEESTKMQMSLKPHAVVSVSSSLPDYLSDSDEEDDLISNKYGTITKQKIAGEDAEEPAWGGGWGFGRIAKALWG